MAHATDALNELITSTLHAFEKAGVVQDAIFSGDPLLSLLESKGKKQVRGGERVRVNLRYGKNENVGSYYGSDTLDTGEIDTLAHADFDWSQYSGGFSIPEIELLQNMGDKTKIVDLWKEKVEVTTLSLKDEMITGLYGDGTGNGGKDILGLDAILSDTGILGGIDRDLAPWWQAQVTARGGAAPTIAAIKTKIRQIRGPEGRPDKRGKVDMIMVDGDMYDYLLSLIDEKTVLNSVGGPLVELGFDAFRISGAEVTWSENVPAGDIWYLSTEYLGIRVFPGRDFAFEGPISALVNDQDVKKAWVLWAGQMVVSNCRYLGRDTGWTIP